MKSYRNQISWGVLGVLVIGFLLGCELATSVPVGPATPTIYAPETWIQVDDYTIIVHDVFQEELTHPDGKKERVVYLNVEYDNQGREPLDYRLNQWSVFDTENYTYDYEIMNVYYQDQGRPRLEESVLNPGMQVKGWAAFPVPEDVTIDRVQFLTGYLDGHAADIVIEPLAP